MSKNKLVRKNPREIDLIWKLLAPGYGLLQPSEKVGILPFEVYERVGKSVFSVCKRAQKSLKVQFLAEKKVKKTSWFFSQ